MKIKKVLAIMLAFCMVLGTMGNVVFAENTTEAPALPEATVENLGGITIDDYDVYDGKGLVAGGDPIGLQIAMEFVAQDTEETAKANYYAEYTTDFFIQINGLANGSFDGTGCYLAGHYGDFGWVKVPLDGMTIENGVIYPVITSVGFDFSYVDICTLVKDFKCGIYLTDKVLEENPDMQLTLTLGLSENVDAALSGNYIKVDDVTYATSDFTPALPEAKVENLGNITIDDYDVYNGSSLVAGGAPIDLQIAMEFVAQDTDVTAKENYYAGHTTDFFIQIEGLANGSFDGTGSYLAGHYGDFGWVKVPLDGMTIENGVIYPVITSVGFDFSYVDICTLVKDFKCGIYLTDKVLEENPDMQLTLTLGLSEDMDAAVSGDYIKVDDVTYTRDDFIIVEPTIEPTIEPTVEPTVEPTEEPVVIPEGAPAVAQTEEGGNVVEFSVNEASSVEAVYLLNIGDETEYEYKNATKMKKYGQANGLNPAYGIEVLKKPTKNTKIELGKAGNYVAVIRYYAEDGGELQTVQYPVFNVAEDADIPAIVQKVEGSSAVDLYKGSAKKVQQAWIVANGDVDTYEYTRWEDYVAYGQANGLNPEEGFTTSKGYQFAAEHTGNHIAIISYVDCVGYTHRIQNIFHVDYVQEAPSVTVNGNVFKLNHNGAVSVSAAYAMNIGDETEYTYTSWGEYIAYGKANGLNTTSGCEFYTVKEDGTELTVGKPGNYVVVIRYELDNGGTFVVQQPGVLTVEEGSMPTITVEGRNLKLNTNGHTVSMAYLMNSGERSDFTYKTFDNFAAFGKSASFGKYNPSNGYDYFHSLEDGAVYQAKHTGYYNVLIKYADPAGNERTVLEKYYIAE